MKNKELISLLHNTIYFDYFAVHNTEAEVREIQVHEHIIKLVNSNFFPGLFFDLGVIFHRVDEEIFSWDNTIMDFYLHMDSSQPEQYLFTKQVMFKETLAGGAGIGKQVTYYRKLNKDVSTGASR